MTKKEEWTKGFEQIRENHPEYADNDEFNNLIQSGLDAIENEDFDAADEAATELDVGFDIQRSDYEFLPQED